MTTRVLIADDEVLLRSGLRAILELEDDLEVVGEAEDGAAATDLAIAHHPHVILMDVRMPRVGGIEAIRRLQAARSQARVLVLTTFDVDEDVHAALQAGASGFLLKSASPDALVDAVRRTARGEVVMDPSVTHRLVDRFLAQPTRDASAAGVLATLTPREADVLGLLARGLSNGEIADALVVSEGTVKTHVTSLLSKLGLRSRLQAVVFAYETGLVRPAWTDGSRTSTDQPPSGSG